jgi:hypothetical protein
MSSHPHSPDLAALNFFSLGTLINEVFGSEPGDIGELKVRVW